MGGAVATTLLRICLIWQLLNSLFRYFLPKRLISLLLPHSWLSIADQGGEDNKNKKHTVTTTTTTTSACSAPSTDSAAELKRVFQMFDRNGDGRITRKELTDSLENLGIYISDGDLAAIIGRIDVDGDGCVDAGEFAALYREITGGGDREVEEEEEEEMKEAFDVFDENGDGFITAEELRSVLGSLGLKQGRMAAECRRMISKVDADGDGMVDFEEFKQMMRSGGGGFTALD